MIASSAGPADRFYESQGLRLHYTDWGNDTALGWRIRPSTRAAEPITVEEMVARKRLYEATC
jgi:hypothetical protein